MLCLILVYYHKIMKALFTDYFTRFVFLVRKHMYSKTWKRQTGGLQNSCTTETSWYNWLFSFSYSGLTPIVFTSVCAQSLKLFGDLNGKQANKLNYTKTLSDGPSAFVIQLYHSNVANISIVKWCKNWIFTNLALWAELV